MNRQSRLKRGQVGAWSFITDELDLWKINGRPYPLLLIGLTLYNAVIRLQESERCAVH
jgi:hypothetical protein